jgi:hypothetical protein
MSKDLAVSMDELEMESAELLPSRETLYCWRGGYSGGGNSFAFTQVAQGGNSFGGLINIPILSGDAVNLAL